MKTLFLITSMLFATFMVSCNRSEKDTSENKIVGTWKLVENKDGGSPNPDWQPVAYSYTRTFNIDGTFSSTANVNCTKGTYTLTDNKLTLNFDCGTFPPIGDNGTIVNNFMWDGNDFILTPTLLGQGCFEGCAFKFRKNDN
jgi:hypothetical protein